MSRRPARLLAAFDFDGTLAPLASRPERARMPAGTRAALRRLASRASVRVAVVSGRAVSDVWRAVGVPGVAYAGNHGFELRVGGRTWVHPAVRAAGPSLARTLRAARVLCATAPGSWVEDKGGGFSVHVRAVRSPRAEAALRDSLAALVSREPRLALRGGKRVYEVRPRARWDKSDAVRRLRRRLAPGGACLYAGDDLTDEDVFRRLAGRALTVKVGPGPTAAALRASGPAAVRRLLAALARAF